MARLFLFAVGGTGSRVLKSLTMLLAAGVKPQSGRDFEIVPIIIDPHKSNDDLKRTVRLMDNYQAITKKVGVDNGFFATKITTLDHLGLTENKLSSNFTLTLQQVANTRFRDYIEFNQLSEPTKGLADILFSGKTIDKHGEPVNLMDIEMDIGFIGNPNIGSVVLNQFKDSDEFREIASQFSGEDRIFIISSIFGGTGAAGFPIILKNIRNAMNNSRLNARGLLENAKIGAITVLPYFNLENSEKSPIHKSVFIGKTKAALYYYLDNVNPSVNALYYLNDDFTGNPYKNDPGDDGQQNQAHFIEMVAALSVIDFLEIPDEELNTEDGVPVNPVYKEFGIRVDSPIVQFGNLEDRTEEIIAKRLSQFSVFQKYMKEQLKLSLGRQRWSLDEPAIPKQFTDDTFYRSHLTEFMNAYVEWLTEMQQNRRGFGPFSLESPLNAFIMGRDVNSKWFSGKVDMSDFDDALSKTVRGKTYQSPEQKMIRLFFNGSEELLKSKFGFKN